MRWQRAVWLSGPIAVKDFVGGVSGIAVSLVAIIAGCAFASAGNMVWFGFLGLAGAVSLHTCIPQIRLMQAVLANQPLVRDDDALPRAA